MLRNSLLSAYAKCSSLTCVQSKLIFENPYEKLKQYLEVPLLDDQFFSPDIESLVAAHELFVPNPLHRIGFITSGIGPEKFPNHDLPEKRGRCIRTFLLIDGKVGFEDIDQIALDVLENYKVPHVIVMTKIDKISDGILLKNVLHLKNIRKSTVYCFSQPFAVSSHTYEGLGHLLAFIGHITGNVNIKSADIKSISH
ncbi:GTP-binding protein 8 like protein [Argiope bruennichi]|uniref:GTP-binding protein 8 like protein n=1 Tax=Argiope bruennichi TaxID=94029 RepID=A0A8T0ERL7_ARGBR|nr:GTP-binding protein 8 like protein [Argiope bruennichi]